MATYWIRRKELFGAFTYECSNCKAVTKQKLSACPYCGKLMSGVRNGTTVTNAIEMLMEDENTDNLGSC